MTGMLLRALVILFIVGIIVAGVRRIWRDWTKQFRVDDQKQHERDLREREQPGVITLERSADGTFRPPSNDNRR